VAAGTPIDAHGSDTHRSVGWTLRFLCAERVPLRPSELPTQAAPHRVPPSPSAEAGRRGVRTAAFFSGNPGAICSIFCSPTAGAGNTRLIFSAAIGRGLVRSPTADYPRKEQPRSPTAQGISSPPLPARSRPSKRIRAFCLSPAGKTLLKNSLLRISKHYLISVYNPLN